MTVPFQSAGHGVRMAQDAKDLAACQALRHMCFFGTAGRDEDAHDAVCDHLMIAGPEGLVGTCRLRVLDAATLEGCYTAESYDLARLKGYPAPLLELGRFCIAEGAREADAIRLAWGMLARIVDARGIGLVFGCASFPGLAQRDAGFSVLARRHRAPQHWAPQVRAAEIVPLVDAGHDTRAGLREIPALLRSYLGLGGWVSDHAVIDRRMQTLHVLTAVEIARVPEGRARALRAVMGACS